MCDKCFNKNYKGFLTQQDFLEFDKNLTLKLNNDLKISKMNEQYRNVYFDQYQCLNCLQIWNFSLPDNAWRGFFLDNDSLKRFVDGFKKADSSKAKMGFLISLIITGFLIYMIVK